MCNKLLRRHPSLWWKTWTGAFSQFLYVMLGPAIKHLLYWFCYRCWDFERCYHYCLLREKLWPSAMPTVWQKRSFMQIMVAMCIVSSLQAFGIQSPLQGWDVVWYRSLAVSENSAEEWIACFITIGAREREVRPFSHTAGVLVNERKIWKHHHSIPFLISWMLTPCFWKGFISLLLLQAEQHKGSQRLSLQSSVSWTDCIIRVGYIPCSPLAEQTSRIIPEKLEYGSSYSNHWFRANQAFGILILDLISFQLIISQSSFGLCHWFCSTLLF
jgi:hypothetical protein